MDTRSIGGCDPQSAICARGITRDFEAGQTTIRVLHGIDTDIRSGEMTYVVGESGSGKTTLISIMCGILWPTSGEVKVFGTDIYKLSDTELVNFRLNNIGFIFQQYNLIPSIDAVTNAAVPLIAQGMRIAEARERAQVLLDKLNIGDEALKLPRQLSGGQQQRVAIARALATNPSVMLCDEPSGSLDFETGKHIFKLLRDLNQQNNKVMCVVTHNAPIGEIGDRVIRLHDGKIADITVNEHPLDPDQLRW